MNYKWVIGAMLLLLTSTCTLAQGTFIIEGKVKNVKQGVCLNLLQMEGNASDTIAVDTLRGDTFRFEQQTLGEGTDELLLMITDDGVDTMCLELWARPGTHIRLTGNDMLIRTWLVESDVPQQHTHQIFINDSRDLWNEYQLNEMQVKRLFHQYKSKNTTDEEKDELLVKGVSLLRANDVIRIRIGANIIRRMYQLPVDEIWMKQLMGLAKDVKTMKSYPYPYRSEVEELYASLSEEQRQSPEGLDILAYLSPPDTVILNKKAVDGNLFDLEGNEYHLSDFRGKPVLINFWSRGCEPCMMALPEMKEISKMYEGRLELVSINIDNIADWGIASRHHEITWWNLNDLIGRHGIYAKYEADSIPRYVFLSPEGKVAEMWSGYAKGSLLKKLEKLMK